jgi:hypothetical protein
LIDYYLFSSAIFQNNVYLTLTSSGVVGSGQGCQVIGQNLAIISFKKAKFSNGKKGKIKANVQRKFARTCQINFKISFTSLCFIESLTK